MMPTVLGLGQRIATKRRQIGNFRETVKQKNCYFSGVVRKRLRKKAAEVASYQFIVVFFTTRNRILSQFSLRSDFLQFFCHLRTGEISLA